MKKIVAFFIRYPIWTNVLMISIFAFGIVFFGRMNYSAFPEVPPSFIFVNVPFPGASPEEVEEGVVLKIEENLDGLEGIDRVTSTSQENMATVSIEILEDADIDQVLSDVNNAVDQISAFPLGAEKPIIFKQPALGEAVNIIVYGETDLYNLKTVTEELRDELLATPEISQIDILGLPDLEISIEASEANLRRYQLTFNEIANAVRNANINISGGKFETRDEEILIRAYGRNYQARELENLVLRSESDGTVVYLKDVAAIREQWEDVPDKVWFDDRSALILDVNKTLDESVLKVVEVTQVILDDFNARHPQIQAMTVNDNAETIDSRLKLFAQNGLVGLILVICIVGLFMNMRLSFWVSIGIPFSFAGMFIVASIYGITVNVISTFGMIIVIGILVDDAIVVGENIYAHYERGKGAVQAAIDGTNEMLGPVFTSVTTTMIAFTPYFFIAGFLGKFIWQMALVVIAALFFSLVEAFLVLPAHLAHSKGLHAKEKDSPIRKKLDAAIDFLTHRLYAPSLRVAMNNKWVTVITPVALVFVTIGLLRGGFIGATFFPFIDTDVVFINASLVAGRQEQDTNRLLEKIELAARQVNEDLKEQRPDNKDVIIGVQREIGRNDLGDVGSHAGKISLHLLDGEVRNLETFKIANMVRAKTGPLPEVQKMSFGTQGFFGKAISISLLSNDFEQLNEARDLLINELVNMDKVKDITDSNQEGRREIDIALKPRAHALGLTLRDVAGQVRQGFFGEEVQRIQRGRDEIRVWVRYREEDRASLGYLERMRIRTPDGAEYPFSELADYEIQRGLTQINHLDNRREVRIEANQANVEDDLPPILTEIQEVIVPRILSQVDGVTVSYEGQSRSQARTNESMGQAFGVAMLMMFILVTLVFRSPLQAFLVFGLIPFGFLGAIWGHGILGIQLNSLSTYGLIALSGIIINDSIVFIDQINRNLRSGMKVYDAVFNAGLARLRPIILTSFTTFAGLAPMILEGSRQAQFLIPMAVAVAYGLLFGTFLLLLVLPASYLILNRIRIGAARMLRRKSTPELVEPAVKELEKATAGLLVEGK